MPRPVKTHIFNGNKYLIKHLPPSRIQKGTAYGTADHPTTKNKCIEIANNLEGKELLRVYIHEALHCINFLWPENFVDRASRDLSGFLWRLGYDIKEKK